VAAIDSSQITNFRPFLDFSDQKYCMNILKRKKNLLKLVWGIARAEDRTKSPDIFILAEIDRVSQEFAGPLKIFE